MNTNILKISIAAAGMLMMFAGLASAQELSSLSRTCDFPRLLTSETNKHFGTGRISRMGKFVVRRTSTSV